MITLTDVTKTYGGLRVLGPVDLHIPAGGVTALVGPNGAGKSTLLTIVGRLTEPTTGTITSFGAAPRQAVHAGRVSAVLQTGGLLNDLTARETVRYIASTFAQHEPVEGVLERAGLADKANRRVSKLSGGEQQRLRFALALLSDRPCSCSCSTRRPPGWTSRGADGTGSQIKALASGRTVRATVTSRVLPRPLRCSRVRPGRERHARARSMRIPALERPATPR